MGYPNQPERLVGPTPLEIDGVEYFTAAEVASDVGVSRQTLWRWRQERKIPIGRRYRNRQVLFTAEDVLAVREYANRIEPADVPTANQLKLFNGSKGGSAR